MGENKKEDNQLVDGIHEMLMNDPDFIPPANVTKDDAAWAEAWRRFRQKTNNEKALSMGEDVIEKHYTPNKPHRHAPSFEVMEKQHNLDKHYTPKPHKHGVRSALEAFTSAFKPEPPSWENQLREKRARELGYRWMMEKQRPPRPGLVPQSGDPRHPYRWVRPEHPEAIIVKPHEVEAKQPKLLRDLVQFHPSYFHSVNIAAQALKRAGVQRAKESTTAVRGWHEVSVGVTLHSQPFSNHIQIGFTQGALKAMSPAQKFHAEQQIELAVKTLEDIGFKKESTSDYGDVLLKPDYAQIPEDAREVLAAKAIAYANTKRSQAKNYGNRRDFRRRDEASFEASRMEEIAKDIQGIPKEIINKQVLDVQDGSEGKVPPKQGPPSKIPSNKPQFDEFDQEGSDFNAIGQRPKTATERLKHWVDTQKMREGYTRNPLTNRQVKRKVGIRFP